MEAFLMFMVITGLNGDSWPPKTWTQPAEPFRIAGPVYYVGGRELTAYLVVDEKGMILVNVGMRENVPQVIASIRKLGFDPNNIKTLLITQAHMDHSGGAALLQQQTGCEIVVGTADIPLMKSGGISDPVLGDKLPFDPVAEPRGVGHGDEIPCGNLTLKTIATPGHTPGSSSWLLTIQHKGEPLQLLFQGSISVLPDSFKGDKEAYPGMIEDFERSIGRLTSVGAHLVLPDHMVFAHPAGTTHRDPIDAAWFRRSDILRKQIQRAQKALERFAQRDY